MLALKSHGEKEQFPNFRKFGCLEDYRNLDDLFDDLYLRNLHKLDDQHRRFQEGREVSSQYCCWRCIFCRSSSTVYGRGWSKEFVNWSWRCVSLRRGNDRGAERRPTPRLWCRAAASSIATGRRQRGRTWHPFEVSKSYAPTHKFKNCKSQALSPSKRLTQRVGVHNRNLSVRSSLPIKTPR